MEWKKNQKQEDIVSLLDDAIQHIMFLLSDECKSDRKFVAHLP